MIYYGEPNIGLDKETCFTILHCILFLLNIFFLIIYKVLKRKNVYTLGKITNIFNLLDFLYLCIYNEFFDKNNDIGHALSMGFFLVFAFFLSCVLNFIILLFYDLSIFDIKKKKEKSNDINIKNIIIYILYIFILIILWLIIYL